MKLKKIGLVVATSAAAGMLALGGMSIANAETAAPSASGSAAVGETKPGKGPRGTAVAGDEAAKVTAALNDPAVTVAEVRKEADGTYAVFGTKDGAKVKFDVSADLKTVTQGKPRGPKGTPVTGDEAAKVTEALNDPAVTVAEVRKEADGSYDVFGTKDGAKVKFDVSADLKTVTQAPARHGRPGGGGPKPAPGSTTG